MVRTSRAVYRRRRLVLFSGLILLLAAIAVGVWLLVAQPWADAATEQPSTPAPSASQTSTPKATAPDETEPPEAEPPETETPETETPDPNDTIAAAAPCRGTDIVVEAVTDADTYAAGVSPQLSISLTNEGASACTLDVGSATQIFTVTSGSDVWWRSTDCQENPSSMVATLEAGQTVTSATPVVWDRTRSDVSTCNDENRPHAPGGGASYHVAVMIGGFEALNTAQILLY